MVLQKTYRETNERKYGTKKAKLRTAYTVGNAHCIRDEAMKKLEFVHERKHFPICPYCNHADRYFDDVDSDELELICPNCNKDYYVIVFTEFSTVKP